MGLMRRESEPSGFKLNMSKIRLCALVTQQVLVVDITRYAGRTSARANQS